MNQARESRIINILMAGCLIAGFTCFSLIILPDQIGRAKPGGANPMPSYQSPQNLSSIIPLEQPSEKNEAASEGKNVVRFDPEPLPPPPGYADAPVVGDSKPDSAMSDAAGGAGAAIDDADSDMSFEVAGDYPPPSLKEAEEEPAPLMPDEKSDYSLNLKTHRSSSLAMNAPSLLDSKKISHDDRWVLIPGGLETDVAFWRDIYAKYDTNKVVFHHPQYLFIVYDVIDLSDIERDPRLTDIEREYMREKRVEKRRDEIADILKKLATNPKASSLTEEEWRIRELFKTVDEKNAFLRAAEEYGVRAQVGQSDKFLAGLRYSGRYLGEIEAIYEKYGLPRELTRLIFVESMFNTTAKSKSGASGIWQFMPQTGRLYLRINDIIDERNDPLIATHASAKLLRYNYNELGTWPLAINAYNAGRGRLQQAVNRLGTKDIAAIIRNFRHPAYGFASRNFFPEFLAALDVVEHAEKYFGPIDYDEPLKYEEVRSSCHISLPDVARLTGIPFETIQELNPAFGARVTSGKKLVPIGFAIRIPPGKGELFLAMAARAPKSRTGQLKHVVERGDTLDSIAAMYGVTPADIRTANRNIGRNPRRGQTIVIPFER